MTERQRWNAIIWTMAIVGVAIMGWAWSVA